MSMFDGDDVGFKEKPEHTRCIKKRPEAPRVLASQGLDSNFTIIISPNEVFGDIMVLASPPRPPVDPDDVNTNSKNI